MSINLFDAIVFVILVAFMLLSYVRGATRELLSLVGLVIGYWAGLKFHQDLGGMLEPIVQDLQLAELLSFVMILVAGYLVGAFVGGFREGRPRGLLNHLIGGGVGVLKGLVVSLALYWVVIAYVPPFQDELAASRSAPYLGLLLQYVTSLTL